MTLALTFLESLISITLRPVLIRDTLASWSNKRNLKTNPPETLGNCVQLMEKFQPNGHAPFKKLLDKNVLSTKPMSHSNKKLISNLISCKLSLDLTAASISTMNNTVKIGVATVQLGYTKVPSIYHWLVF